MYKDGSFNFIKSEKLEQSKCLGKRECLNYETYCEVYAAKCFIFFS